MNNGFCCLDIGNIIGFLRNGGAHPPIWRVKILTFVMDVLICRMGFLLYILRRV
jgi:hypothetical protein